MSYNDPTLIRENNLSIAWARSLFGILDNSISGSLTLAINGFEGDLPAEDLSIRAKLDETLRRANIPTVAQTALAIVPYKHWLQSGKPSVGIITDWYLTRLLPRLKARCSKNRHGTYFERLVAYSGVKNERGIPQVRSINQLQFVIDLWKRRVERGPRPRQSALQLACFDPAKDDTGAALLGFPCLQQISLTYREEGTLEVNGYYPTQYLFDRAYGNYLGLCQLGHVIAHELDVRFTGLTCFVARPQLGSGNKCDHAKLVDFARAQLDILNLQAVEASQVAA